MGGRGGDYYTNVCYAVRLKSCCWYTKCIYTFPLILETTRYPPYSFIAFKLVSIVSLLFQSTRPGCIFLWTRHIHDALSTTLMRSMLQEARQAREMFCLATNLSAGVNITSALWQCVAFGVLAYWQGSLILLLMISAL